MNTPYKSVLTLLHLERPKLYAILAYLSAVGLRFFSLEEKLNLELRNC